MTPDRNETRRGFLDWLVTICCCVTAAALALPGAMYLWPAAKGGADETVELQGADSMTPGQSRTIQVGGKAVIVVRNRSGFSAFSAVCTHLGCLVTWEASKGEFLCPCHAAVFDAKGRVVSGPPPAPLPVYAVKEVSGKVYVSAG